MLMELESISRVWVLGTLLKMFHLKNPYQDEYDEEMEKWTAHKPEVTEDDSADNSLREAILVSEKAVVRLE